jgi:hypothetical protein
LAGVGEVGGGGGRGDRVSSSGSKSRGSSGRGREGRGSVSRRGLG